MPVEPLDLGEEPHVERVVVEHADRVVRIDRRHQPVAGVLDRLQMPGRDEAADAGHGEILHGRTSASMAAAGSRGPRTFDHGPERRRQRRRVHAQGIAFFNGPPARHRETPAQRRVGQQPRQLLHPLVLGGRQKSVHAVLDDCRG